MNSRLGYFFLESQPELRENHSIGAELQNAQTGVSITIIRSVPADRGWQYILKNKRKEKRDVKR